MIPDVTFLALTCLLLLGAGYGILIGLSLIPALRGFTTEAWPILLTETLIVGVAVGAVWLGGWVLQAGLLLLAARTGFEAVEVAVLRLPDPPKGISAIVAVSLVLVCLAAWALPLALTCALALIGIIACGIGARGVPAQSPRGVILDLLLFPILPLIVFVTASLQGFYGGWLLVAFMLVETFDSYALAGGKLFGRHKAFPHLSPKKTVEGLVVGAVALMLTAAGAGWIMAGAPVLASGALALFVGALAVTGDLTASRLKRRSGVKDFPAVLPHQGGLLDITDAWIAAGAGLIALVTLFGLE